jgi:RNA recognition motif-containing protein
MTTLYVSNLSYRLTAAELAYAFERYGHVTQSWILTRGRGRRPRSCGYGFVNFERPREAQAALNEPNPIMLRDRETHIELAYKKALVKDTVFNANLGSNVTREVSLRFFAEFDPVDASIAYTRESDNRREFGHVKVASKEKRDAAIAALNDRELEGEHEFVTTARRRLLAAEEVGPRRVRREERRRRGDVAVTP